MVAPTDSKLPGFTELIGLHPREIQKHFEVGVQGLEGQGVAHSCVAGGCSPASAWVRVALGWREGGWAGKALTPDPLRDGGSWFSTPRCPSQGTALFPFSPHIADLITSPPPTHKIPSNCAQSGSHVKVEHGQHMGETGMVVTVTGPIATIFTDVSRQEIRVFVKDLVQAVAVTSSVDTCGAGWFGGRGSPLWGLGCPGLEKGSDYPMKFGSLQSFC